MHPSKTAKNYSRIAGWWQERMLGSGYGVAQLERTIQFSGKKGFALDVGCGSEGRFIEILGKNGFEPEGVDISDEMVTQIRARHPNHQFYSGDICTWELPRNYEFISAWDSTFHLPLDQQHPVLEKLCAGLATDGVLLFTCGGGDEPGEISGSFAGEDFEYSTLGVAEFLRLLAEFGCAIKHVEYDQHPENHVYVIAQKA